MVTSAEQGRRLRILFVDDETSMLTALQNLLYRDRKRWDLVFAVGGEQAIKELERASFDVVVSDMRMPGVDGAALLELIKAKYPETARIVLSGHAERGAVMRAIPVAQQYIAKPCDADALRRAIERVAQLHDVLNDQNIRATIGRLTELPSVPQTYMLLTRAASRPTATLKEFAEIVEQDTAMVIKVLQLVNSAYFGVAQRVTSIQNAISYLGIELIKALALNVGTFAMAGDVKMPPGWSLEQLQQHALTVAQLAKRLVKTASNANEAFTAALVHDVGHVIMAKGVPEKFERAVLEAQHSGRAQQELELEVMGVTHAEVGAYLLGTWGLPHSIVESVAHHHHPMTLVGEPTDLLLALHVADAVATGPDTFEQRLDPALRREPRYATDFERWRALISPQPQPQAHAEPAAGTG